MSKRLFGIPHYYYRLRSILKGALTRSAMDDTLNQWPTLVGCCEGGDLQISNVLAEKAIRPFALGRKSVAVCGHLTGRRCQCNVLLPG